MPGARYRLLIGNKAWSSWSLRPWLVMRRFGVPFEEINVRLRQPDSKAQILAHSPAGMVPALIVGELVVWDSLAIIEFVQDRHPDLAIWPKDSTARAVARSVAAEMHSGFQPLRETCAMNLFARTPLAEFPDKVDMNIRRIVSLWGDCRQKFGGRGPFLFSEFSAADAMYAPVASRFRTYVPDLTRFGDDGMAQAYVDAIFAMPEMAEWAEGAKREAAAV